MMDPSHIHHLYAQSFGNLAEVAPPQLYTQPALLALMQRALHRGTPLTDSEIQSAFPNEDFEQVLP